MPGGPMPGPYVHIAAGDRTAAHLRRINAWPAYLGGTTLAGPDTNPIGLVSSPMRSGSNTGSLSAS